MTNMTKRIRRFDYQLSLAIDALHHALAQADSEPNQFKRIRKVTVLREKLRRLEKRIKV